MSTAFFIACLVVARVTGATGPGTASRVAVDVPVFPELCKIGDRLWCTVRVTNLDSVPIQWYSNSVAVAVEITSPANDSWVIPPYTRLHGDPYEVELSAGESHLFYLELADNDRITSIDADTISDLIGYFWKSGQRPAFAGDYGLRARFLPTSTPSAAVNIRLLPPVLSGSVEWIGFSPEYDAIDSIAAYVINGTLDTIVFVEPWGSSVAPFRHEGDTWIPWDAFSVKQVRTVILPPGGRHEIYWESSEGVRRDGTSWYETAAAGTYRFIIDASDGRRYVSPVFSIVH